MIARTFIVLTFISIGLSSPRIAASASVQVPKEALSRFIKFVPKSKGVAGPVGRGSPINLAEPKAWTSILQQQNVGIQGVEVRKIIDYSQEIAEAKRITQNYFVRLGAPNLTTSKHQHELFSNFFIQKRVEVTLKPSQSIRDIWTHFHDTPAINPDPRPIRGFHNTQPSFDKLVEAPAGSRFSVNQYPQYPRVPNNSGQIWLEQTLNNNYLPHSLNQQQIDADKKLATRALLRTHIMNEKPFDFSAYRPPPNKWQPVKDHYGVATIGFGGGNYIGYQIVSEHCDYWKLRWGMCDLKPENNSQPVNNTIPD